MNIRLLQRTIQPFVCLQTAISAPCEWSFYLCSIQMQTMAGSIPTKRPMSTPKAAPVVRQTPKQGAGKVGQCIAGITAPQGASNVWPALFHIGSAHAACFAPSRTDAAGIQIRALETKLCFSVCSARPLPVRSAPILSPFPFSAHVPRLRMPCLLSTANEQHIF